jgi:hypothetical protein
MESLQLTFKTLPGVGNTYSLVIGSNENPNKVCKILTVDEYKKLEKRAKKGKKRSKKGRGTKETSAPRTGKPAPKKNGSHIKLSMGRKEMMMNSLNEDCDDMAKKIEEGIKIHGENREAIVHAYAEIEKGEREEEKGTGGERASSFPLAPAEGNGEQGSPLLKENVNIARSSSARRMFRSLGIFRHSRRRQPDK